MPDPESNEDRTTRRDLRRALAFGIVMATIQMSVLVWLLYC
jgi:hypothetical protein